MKVEIDYELCESNGVCAALVPTVFDLRDDDQLYLLVDDVPAEDEAAVRTAVQRCPRQAITAQ